MKITNLTINANFRYLWLKTVRDVDLTQHCARSLVGEYDKRISPTKRVICDIDLQDSVYYLCGVAFPFNWSKNFHLAFMPSPGKSIHYESNGITVDIEDAERLPISQDYVDMSYPKARLKAYHTCRNYQFAHWFKANLGGSEPR